MRRAYSCGASASDPEYFASNICWMSVFNAEHGRFAATASGVITKVEMSKERATRTGFIEVTLC